MAASNPTAIYEKLNRLERELQRLKVQTYRTLPRSSRIPSPYAEKAIEQAVKDTRKAIWEKRYATKIARIR
jgi:hypothetical protein